MTERPSDYAPLTYERTLAGFLIPATRYVDALRLRAKLTTGFLDAVLSRADVLLMPCMAIETPTIAEVSAREMTGEILPMIASFTRLTRTINYLGLPALSVPCGTDSNGMPVAFQLVGRPLAEPLLLALGDHFERRVGCGVPKPVLGSSTAGTR
jgi:aspartyl-tRNA(Asn)/glutamyl-tRNA(Gln) amidotransferase subunit A